MDGFRLNNLSHNTLVVDGQLQLVKGVRPSRVLGRSRGAYTVIDLAPVYEGSLPPRNGVKLVGTAVLVQDGGALEQTASVRWGMVTRAEVALLDDAAALLQTGWTRLVGRVLFPRRRLQLYETENPPPIRRPEPQHPDDRFESEIGAGHRRPWRCFCSPASRRLRRPR